VTHEPSHQPSGIDQDQEATMPTLPTITLGPQGHDLTVPALGYGAVGLSASYGPVHDAESLRTLNHALDAGITLLDTADVYGRGHNERLLSQVLKHRRDEVVLASKTGIIPDAEPGGPKAHGDPESVRRSLDESLQRLGVETIDLFYYHRVDSRVPIEETVGAFAQAVDAGKIRRIGLSEVTSSELRRAAAVHPITAVQSEYSLFSRDVEDFVLPAAASLGVGFVAYSPLGRGFLSGQVSSVADLGPDDARRKFPRFGPEEIAANLRLVDTVNQVAIHENATPAQVALAWLAARGKRLGVGLVPIPGTRRTERIDENLDSLDLVLSPESLASLDSLAAQVSGERAQDVNFIAKGRESFAAVQEGAAL
jgi:aryl-alcohol dehydrogenase-like predicted oxidoreductase